MTWDCSITGVAESPAGILITTKMVVRDELAVPLVTHLWTSIAIRGSTEFLGGEALPDHRFPAESREHLLGSGRSGSLTTTERRTSRRPEITQHTQGTSRWPLPKATLASSCGHVHFRIAVGVATRLAGGDSREAPTPGHTLGAPVLLGRDLTVDVFEVPTRTTIDGQVLAFEARQGDQLCLSHGRAEFGPAR